ncbi:RNA polymerase RpoE-like sigma-24 subunit [Curtobacterium sp. PhB42]|uniref:RNA polymerase sigma factor n=1 Tax=unclassified Curtobacterium TaxID=257496 RepID=UPI001064238F|nr:MULTISPECIES: sigma-70 family RNA polymerase sigma factor [unclassified Curtobacterium]TDW42419.1 RNA polymerase RpoE-like sigma-24 subunit [Curtobacterium sp. PhB42]TDW55491.1 RNA polymerase RpoE-like sigma-24 subunit [Curtobacterium sp. PhB190]
MKDEQDDGPLWTRAVRDDGAAFAALFDRHRPRIYRRALSLTEHSHDAEDITAAAFYELWRKRKSVTLVAGSVAPWLLVTTVNLTQNHRRAAARYRRLLEALPRDDAQAPATDAEDLEARERLRTTIRGLAPQDAALLVLTGVEEMPVWQAAQAVGLKPPAARVRLHRMRQRLQRDLHDLRPSVRNAPEGTY